MMSTILELTLDASTWNVPLQLLLPDGESRFREILGNHGPHARGRLMPAAFITSTLTPMPRQAT